MTNPQEIGFLLFLYMQLYYHIRNYDIIAATHEMP